MRRKDQTLSKDKKKSFLMIYIVWKHLEFYFFFFFHCKNEIEALNDEALGGGERGDFTPHHKITALPNFFLDL